MNIIEFLACKFFAIAFFGLIVLPPKLIGYISAAFCACFPEYFQHPVFTALVFFYLLSSYFQEEYYLNYIIYKKMNPHDSNIASFFKHSEVKAKYVFDQTTACMTENIITDYDTPTYIRIMKKISTPDYIKDDSFEDKLLGEKSQSDFFLRCYLPKQKIIQANPENRIKDVVIMINGLNETARYDFYDQLGSLFASHNIASILLPTPYHLNRRTIVNGQIQSPISIAEKYPLLFYYNFKRSIYEVENLCDRIQGVVKDPNDLRFYEAYFARGENIKIRISLFGFSLGGLRALGCFMKENQLNVAPIQKRYHSCIAFNSTADPFEAAVEKLNIKKDDWNAIRNKVNEEINDNKLKTTTIENERILRIFKWLYNRNNDQVMVNSLKNVSKKFLMVQSGSDKIVEQGSEWNITDPQHGLNRIVVAGVDHIVSMDKNWHQYIASVSEQLMEFIRNANDSSFSVQEIREQIKGIIENTTTFTEVTRSPFKEDIESTYFTLDMLTKLIDEIPNVEDRERFIDLYYQSKGFYPRFPELLSNVMRQKKYRNGVCNIKLNTELRCGPGGEYLSIYQLRVDDEVNILSIEDGRWLKVEFTNATSEKIVGYLETTSV